MPLVGMRGLSTASYSHPVALGWKLNLCLWGRHQVSSWRPEPVEQKSRRRVKDKRVGPEGWASRGLLGGGGIKERRLAYRQQFLWQQFHSSSDLHYQTNQTPIQSINQFTDQSINQSVCQYIHLSVQPSIHPSSQPACLPSSPKITMACTRPASG